MAIIINGTTGISDVDGSASVPAYSGTDSNTGMFFPAADTIAFAEGGTEVMRIDSAGNVGIGISSPAQKLDVTGNIRFGNTTAQPTFYLNNTSSGSWKSELIFTNGASAKWATGVDINAAGNNNFYWYDAAAGAERMRIDSSGNVGIGTSTPLQRFTAVNTSITGGGPATSGSAADPNAVSRFQAGSVVMDFGAYATGNMWIQSRQSNNYATNYDLVLNPNGGNLLLGTTSLSYGGIGNNIFTVAQQTSGRGAGLFYTAYSGDVGTSAFNIGKFDNNSTTSQIFVKFAVNNAGLGCGQINGNGGGAAAFGSFSDRRLKENIVDLPSQLENICNLRPVEFDYIQSEGGGHQTGFIAQEMQEVYPDAVGERAADGMLTVTGWDKTTARLVKAIQEQQAIITDLKARIETLESK
jgi:hypothetical protein